jgi:hypothetical protein
MGWVGRLGPVTGRRFFWSTFALFTVAGLCWTVATPLFNAPDEPQHVLRAVTVVRGEIAEPQVRGLPGGYTKARAAASFVSGSDAHCFAFERDTPASCAHYSHSERVVSTAAEYGRYPPAYYLVVGVPSLASSALNTVYAMRVVALLLVAALLALGAASIAELRERRIAAIGYAFAITPMALFLGSIVNPSGVEIAAAISLWASGSVLAVQSADRIDPRLARRVGIAAAALALCRQLGPLWVAIIAVVVVVLAGRTGVRNLVQSRAARVWGALVAISVVAQVAWVALAGGLNLTNPGAASHDATSLVLRKSFGDSFRFLSQMVGNFGWLDTPVPRGVFVTWVFVLGVLIVLALSWSSRLRAGLLGGILALAVAIPIALEASSAKGAGYLWQGRYGLPLAAGVPIVAGILLARSSNAPMLRGRLAGVLGGAFVFAQFLAFAQSLRRSTVGYDGTFFFFVHPVWKPPVPVVLLLVVYLGVIAAVAVWLLWMPALTGSASRDVDPPSSPSSDHVDVATTTNSL